MQAKKLTIDYTFTEAIQPGDKISVNYDDPNGYGYINDRVNVKTYITEFGPTTGEFTAVTYINPWRQKDAYREIYFGNYYGNQQYVMVVKGKASKEGEFKTTTGYNRDSNYIKGQYGYWRRGYDEWSTYIEYYAPDGEASATQNMAPPTSPFSQGLPTKA